MRRHTGIYAAAYRHFYASNAFQILSHDSDSGHALRKDAETQLDKVSDHRLMAIRHLKIHTTMLTMIKVCRYHQSLYDVPTRIGEFGPDADVVLQRRGEGDWTCTFPALSGVLGIPEVYVEVDVEAFGFDWSDGREASGGGCEPVSREELRILLFCVR